MIHNNNPVNAALADRIEVLMPEALAWLRRLVEVNSFTANRAGVNRVVEITAEMFAPLGFTAERIPSENAEYGDHLLLDRAGTGTEPPVVLVTHSDTVFPPEEEARNHFHWREAPDEGRIYGPGTVDNKGGTALIWLMLRTLQDVAPAEFERASWLIAANASEEVVAADFARLTVARCHGRARAVLVFEGGPRSGNEFQIVTARKGRAEFLIQARGRGAHAGSSLADGVNAVVALARRVPLIAALTDPARELSVNVATIRGGTVLNRVPHEAECALEMRAFDPAVLAAAEEQIRNLIAGTGTDDAALSLHCLGRTPAWPADEQTLQLHQLWERAAASLGLCAIPIRRGGLSDANYLAGLGPMLDGLGPAGANAHCSETNPAHGKTPEYVENSSFQPKALLNLAALRMLLDPAKL